MMEPMTNTVIVGAGPYGLSIAANLRHKGIAFRIFGRPMDSWVSHMPKGMLLKSDGFASNLDDAQGEFTLGAFCKENGIKYADTGIPVCLETFAAYGLAFKDRKVPELDERSVADIEASPRGFVVRLEDGATVECAKLILAVGVTHFGYVPETLSQLPPEYVTHSACHRDLEGFRGRSVVVIGGGASALDLAALLHEGGANVQLVARKKEVKFHSKAVGHRSLWDRIKRPSSGLGPGWKNRFFANHPAVFHYLPESLRLEAVRRALGPAGGTSIRDKVIGVVPLNLGYQVHKAFVRENKAVLDLVSDDGAHKEIAAEHIIAATGYKVDLDRLGFLRPEVRARIQTVNGAPVLSSEFESSVKGLYFVGLAAANSFGPVMRFAFGAKFTARTVSRAVARTAVPKPIEQGSAASVTAR